LSLWVAQDSKTTTLGVGRDHTQRFYAGGYVIWVAITAAAVLMRTHVYQVWAFAPVCVCSVSERCSCVCRVLMAIDSLFPSV
jgi:hypothetical protein